MAAYAYAEPVAYQTPPNNEPDVLPFPCASGLGITRGNIVTLASGTLSKPTGAIGTGIAASNILGMTEMDQTAIYTNASVPATPAASNLNLFGTTLQGTVLQPGLEFAGVKVILGHNGQQFEMSLQSGVTWATSLLGSAAGIVYDTTSGFYIVDTTATNVVGNIVGTVDGPNKGAVGDTGKRVLFQFKSTVLAL